MNHADNERAMQEARKRLARIADAAAGERLSFSEVVVASHAAAVAYAAALRDFDLISDGQFEELKATAGDLYLARVCPAALDDLEG